MEKQPIHFEKMKGLIKTVMKRRQKKYQDLAAYLDVSLPTVKRMLNSDDLSFQRLCAILEWLGLSLAQAAKLAEEHSKKEYSRYTTEQEQFLADHPHHHYFFNELMNGYSAKQLAERFNLSEKSVQRYLMDLDHQNLIELHSHGKVKLLNKGTILFREDGPLRNAVKKKWQEQLSKIIAKAFDTETEDDPAIGSQGGRKLVLRRDTFMKMRQDMYELAMKYHEVSELERAIEPRDSLIDVTYYFVAANVDLMTGMYGMPKNFD